MAELVLFFCGILSVACAFLLYRSYRQNGSRLLLWTAVSFSFLAAANIFVCFDSVIFTEVDMGGILVRNALNATASGVLLFALVWEIS